VLSLPLLSLHYPEATQITLDEERKHGNTKQNRKCNKETLGEPKTERLAVAFGALFSLQCVRFITRGSLFIGEPWVWSFASITPFPFLTNGSKHFTRA
jgi:hypothetical protein